jgi:tetratricopeptide (TPR) repeat protein
MTYESSKVSQLIIPLTLVWKRLVRPQAPGSRRCQARYICVLLLAALVFPLVVAAQQLSACEVPKELKQAINSEPSVAAYDSLGVYFGKRREKACAIAMFRQALLLDQASWESHYDLGLALLDQGDTESALRELQRAGSLHPQDKNVHIASAAAFEKRQQFDEAINEYKIVLALDPGNIGGLEGLAKAMIAEKRYTAAVAYLRDAPPDERLQLILATAHSLQGDRQSAIQLLASILKADPACVEAARDLGVAFSAEDRYHEAAQAFQNTLRLDPANEFARISYLNTLIVLEDYSRAEPVAQAYLRQEPHNFDAVYLAGAVKQGLGDYLAAERLLRQAITLESAHYGAHYRLGQISARLGHLPEAREQLQRAIQLKPGSSEAHFQLAKVSQSMGLLGEAKEEFNLVQQEKEELFKKNVATTQADLGNEALRAGNPQRAVALYENSIAEYSKSASIYYNFALALDAQHDLVRERAALNDAIRLDAAFAPAHNQLGVLDLSGGKLQEAETQFQLAISCGPQYAEAQNNLAVLYGRRGEKARAEKLLILATENDPKYAQAFVNLGVLLASESRFAEAEHALGTALQLSPGNAAATSALMLIKDSQKTGPTE